MLLTEECKWNVAANVSLGCITHQHCLNRYDFNLCLKTGRLREGSLKSSGRLFQMAGPEVAKLRGPIVFVFWTMSRWSISFSFKPTGSTTAALVELLHLVHNMFDQGNDYVRCILIDFSKAFDVVNHEILLKELSTMIGMNSSIFNWIAYCSTSRSQAVKLGDIISAFLMITRSIVQGSGLGPYL